MSFPRTTHSIKRRQDGAVFIVMLVVLVMGIAAFFVNSLNSVTVQIKRDEVTANAMAQAKEALIGFAVKVQISSSNGANQPRPGDLPCPDTDNDGEDDPCGNADGSTGQDLRLGRLPWKTLGIPDLRDSSGERLWYAVSNNFKNRTTRSAILNSDTPGTITIRNSGGNIIHNGSAANGAVAIIIAPGDPLSRYDNLQQNRIPANVNNPLHFLDCTGNVINPGVCDIEDNASFTDSSATDGFIQGKIKDADGNITINDQLLIITQDNIMQAVQMRVAAEVKRCLNEYANSNSGRYPWAVPLNDLSYHDSSNLLFGRIPDDFTNTVNDGAVPMTSSWEVMCNTHTSNTPGTWWNSWREMVFYGLADAYKPSSSTTTCPTCLTVSPPSAIADKKFVVIVAGKMLTGQTRTNASDKSTLSNYLEAPNSGGATSFSQGGFTTTFNDTVVFP